MSNPWLAIPLEDYEGHMNASEVAQAGALADLFAEALRLRRPSSVAVLGVAGGNGLERIDGALTRRVMGVDIHPSYLDAVRKRFGQVSGLELHCADLAAVRLALAPVDLVHAALVLEHAGTGLCLDNALSLVAEGGALSVVLQLPSESEHGVGQGGFASMEKLKSHFSFVDAKELCATLSRRGLEPVWETRRSLPAGKAFWMGVFRRRRATDPM
jgi:SAM-dependent methyltransferase